MLVFPMFYNHSGIFVINNTFSDSTIFLKCSTLLKLLATFMKKGTSIFQILPKVVLRVVTYICILLANSKYYQPQIQPPITANYTQKIQQRW